MSESQTSLVSWDLQPGSKKATFKPTDAGLVPYDWEVKPLWEWAEKITVGIASAATYAYRQTGVPLLRNQNIKPGYLLDDDILYVDPVYELRFARKRLSAGDLLTARTGYPGMTCVVPPKYESAQSFTTLITRPKKSEIDSWYLCHYINSERGCAFFEANKIGGAQKNINAGLLKNMPIPAPRWNEQRAIAAALSDADALIDALEKLITKKRAIKLATAQQLLTGRMRLSHFAKPWIRYRFGDIARPRSDRIDARYAGVQEFCVELEHIEQRTGVLTGSTRAVPGSSAKSVFQAEDVLFGKLRAYLQKFWLANRAGVCSTEIWVLVANRRFIIPGFLFEIVQSNPFIEAASTAYGTHMPRSDWNVVNRLEIELPEIDEQIAITSILHDMDEEIVGLERRREKTKAVKQGMTQALLTGRVRLVTPEAVP